MRRIFAVVLLMLFGASQALAQNAPVKKVIKAKKMDVSSPLRELVQKAKPRPALAGQEREVPNMLPSNGKSSKKPMGSVNGPDQLLRAPGVSLNPPTVNLNFAGASNTDNLNVVGFRVAPPDPNMDVGPNHIVQTINLVTTIYNKSGSTLLGPFATSDLWAGFGGDCEFTNDGDPVVLYDHLADRWIISQFVFSVSECVCISQTPDPTGAYFRYEFSTPGNDYPKLGVMEDAYYATIRNFSGAFNIDAAAMDRTKMLAGNPTATIQVFDLSALNPDVEGYLPADLDGPAPPAGTPGFIVGHNGGPTLSHNELEIYKLDVDFATPGNSSLSLASAVTVSQYDVSITTIPQPSPGGGLDDLAIFTMHRVGIRDMGSHFAMVLNHTVDLNNPANHAGIRWYELRDNARTGNNWTLFQEGTHGPDAAHRWMGAIAMNANGDIGLSYTVSSSSVFPSIRVTGRSASDPPGVMMPEVSVVAGTGSQTGTGRWGDYSSLSVDPANNLTFIGTHEYVITTGSFNWWTRIFGFNVSPAGPTPPTITSTPNTSAIVGVPYSYDADNTVNVTGTPPITFTFTGPPGFNVNSSSGLVTWTPASTGSFPVSITATNAQGFDTQNFTINVGTYAARINSGGANFTDGAGDLYVADQPYTSGSFGFVGGTATIFSNAIGGTTDDPLYQAVRRAGGASSFSYRFDVPSAGTYDVKLHLMAPAVGVGNFVMDVLAEGNTVFNNLDINAEAGGTFQALIKTFSATVTDGTLDLDFVTMNKQAIVSGISVVTQTGTPAPEIDVSPLSVNFGNVTVGQNADQNVTINNVGTATLTVSALNITNSLFSLVSPPSVPFNIGPGGSQVLTVRFSPTAAGAQSGNLAISSNDADEPTVNVSLSGTGVTPSLYTARINSGGPNFTTGGGLLFVADQAYNPPSATFGFVGGVSGTNSSAIANTNDDPLYQAFRRSATTAGASFQYNFDVPSGTYSVTLHLAAPNAGGGGSFVMTVQAEGANVPSLTNFDINAQAGGTNTALIVSFSQVVTDGTLNLNFVRVNKASIVSGIEVVQTAGPSLSKSGPSNVAALAEVPAGFKLHPNHPNPFNPTTRIRYEIPRAMSVTLKIYNMLGEEIRTLVASPHNAGSYVVEWDGRQNSGVRAPSGVYLYRLQGEGINEARKMMLVQ